MIKNDRLKVLILAQYFPPDLGGSATRAFNIAKGLTYNGCEVTVVAAFPHYPDGEIPLKYKWKPFKIEWMGKIKVIRTFIFPIESRGLGKRLILFGTFIFFSLFAFPLVGNFDVVWSSNPDLVAIIPAILYCEVKRKFIASNVDDLALEDLYDLNLIKRGSIMAKIIELITKTCYRKATLVTPISSGYIDTLLTYGVDKSKIHVIEGGVDLTIFKQGPRKKRIDSKFIALYSGAFSLAYNFDQILFSAKVIEENDDHIEFVLQGKGEQVAHMRSKIKEMNLKNVHLRNEIISRNEVAELLSEADLLLLPLGDYGKPHLGISAKLYEYQAAGKPILCCSNGTPSMYVNKTHSGIVVKPGEYEALANAIIYLKNNPDIAQIMGENGKKYVEQNLTINILGLKMKEVFKYYKQKKDFKY